MASSKTETASPALRALLGGCELREVAGNTPFLLDDPEACWWLERGTIELFVVELDQAGNRGMRRHFATIEAQSLLCGVVNEALGAKARALLAVPHVNSQVRPLRLAQLKQLGQSAAPELLHIIEPWINGLLNALAASLVPAPVVQQRLEPGIDLRLASSQRLASCSGLAWLELEPDDALFFGTQDLPEVAGKSHFPVNENAWLQSCRSLSLKPDSSAQWLADGRLWLGLLALHQLLIPSLWLNLVFTEIDEHQRLQDRAKATGRDWDLGLGHLQGVLAPKTQDLHPDQADRLVSVMRVIGKAQGFKLLVPPSNRRQHDASDSQQLMALLQASNLRARALTLEADWASQSTEPMLGFARDDGRPLAIVPSHSGKRIRIFDPTLDAKEHPGQYHEGPEALALLSNKAWAFTIPLPPDRLDWKVLPIFSLKRSWRDILTLLLAALAGGLLGMAVPIGSAHLIDSVIPAHERGYLIQIGIMLALLGLASFIMSYIGGIAFSRFQARAGSSLQAAIIDRLLRLPVTFFRNYSSGDLALRANAITQIEQLLSSSIWQALLGAVFALFSFGLLFWYDWRLAFWALGLSVVFMLGSFGVILLQLREERHMAQSEGRLQSLVLQLITGISKLRLSAAEERVFARWAGLFAQNRQRAVRAARYANIQTAFSALFGLLPLFVFFLVLGHIPASQDKVGMSIGSLAAFLAAFGNFNANMTQLLHTIVQMLAVQPLVERALPILEARPEVQENRDDPGQLSGALAWAEVSFRYQADGPLILDRVSLRVQPGEFVAIVGASGCGKSTLLRLLLGFEALQSGAILFDGKDMAELDLLALRRQMGVVLQNSLPMPGSIFENIIGAGQGSLNDAWEAARAAGLAEDIEAMPMGMHTLVTEGGSLSGGQLQRLMIARAIVTKPRILVLDEATSALDNRIQAMVSESLEQLAVTRIVVAHRLSTVTRAHRICVMEAGRIIEQGSYAALMQQGGHFARLAAAQIA
jgi:ATP-binding cassette subfamily C protein